MAAKPDANGVPPLSCVAKIVGAVRDWWRRPIVTWLRKRGSWVFALFAALWLVTAWRISANYPWQTAASHTTQFMVGEENPFQPPISLHPNQQALAIALHLVGWLLVPAVAGAAAGLLATAQLSQFFGQDPDKRIGSAAPPAPAAAQPQQDSQNGQPS